MFVQTSHLLLSLCIGWGLFGVISIRDGERRRTAALVLALGILLQLSQLPQTTDADWRFWPPVVWIVLVGSLAVAISRTVPRAASAEKDSSRHKATAPTRSEQDES